MKVAIVTGAAKGIGRAITMMLAKKGIKVIATYNTSQKQAEEVQKQSKKDGWDKDIFQSR